MGVEGYELGSKSVQEEEAVAFLASEKSIPVSSAKDVALPKLLTRDDLIRIEKEEPIWRRIRTGFMIGFWLLWVSLLAATILLVIFSAKCPNKPDLPFYKTKVGYWLDPHSFKDSDGDGVGDIAGLIDKFDYLKGLLKAGYLILDSVFTDLNDKKFLAPAKNWGFESATEDNVVPVLLKKARREGIELILSVDFNSLPVNNWLQENIQNSMTAPLAKVSRLGGSSETAGKDAYSIYGPNSNLVDVNLINPEVIAKIQEVVFNLLKQGFNGILLKDTAFFTEGESKFQMNEKVNKDSTKNDWFKNYQSDLMFASSSLDVVRAIREAVDNASAITGQEKVLIVDAGNTGWGLPLDQPEPSEMYIGNDTLAHMVIGRHFVLNRGWKAKTENAEAMMPTLSNYLKSTGSKEKRHNSFLCTASPQDVVSASVYRTALSLLLPGPPLIYFGSELDIDYSKATIKALSDALYPGARQAYAAQQDALDKLAVAAHFPMLWDESGLDFSESPQVQAAYKNFLELYNLQKNVELALAEGHPRVQIMNLVRDLISLRKNEPSLQWGDDLQAVKQYAEIPGLEVFRRWGGYGQAPIVVALLSRDFSPAGHVLNLKLADCEDAQVLYTFPENALLKSGANKLASSSVFIEKSQSANIDASLYIFKCKAVF